MSGRTFGNQVRNDGGCNYLGKMMAVEGGSEADDTRIHACTAVRELVVGNTANKELFARQGMTTLVALMGSGSQHVQEAASSAFSEMLEGCAAAKAAARRAGALQALLALLSVRNNRCDTHPSSPRFFQIYPLFIWPPSSCLNLI